MHELESKTRKLETEVNEYKKRVKQISSEAEASEQNAREVLKLRQDLETMEEKTESLRTSQGKSKLRSFGIGFYHINDS